MQYCGAESSDLMLNSGGIAIDHVPLEAQKGRCETLVEPLNEVGMIVVNAVHPKRLQY